MSVVPRNVDQIVEEQCHKWTQQRSEPQAAPRGPVITVSREAGSMGRDLAVRLAADMGLVLSGSSLINAVAQSAKMSESVIRSLDESGRSWVEDLIASVAGRAGLDSDVYFSHLTLVIGALGRHGSTVIVGRGAGFILPPGQNLRVRVIAPLEQRIASVTARQGLSPEAARKQILSVDAGRRAFVKQHFGKDINDPLNYDLVLNGECLGLDAAAAIVRLAASHKA